MKKVLLWALLGVIPFTNLRMVCFDHPVGQAATGVSRSAAAPDCTDFCLRGAPPKPESESESESGCVLVAGGCSVITAAIVIMSPAGVIHRVTLTATPFEPAADAHYAVPLLRHATPPPRS